MKKTNAARVLDRMKIAYELGEYAFDEEHLGAEHVAAEIGLPLDQVFKTLVARGDGREVVMACVPGSGDLDLKALAALAGFKKVEMVPLKEVQPLTGYIRGGVSPLAPKKAYRLFIDASALSFPFISVSAGQRGLQIKVAPGDLVAATGALVGSLVKDR
ncbi:Cys-tRNA(Pro) deacylase [Aminithiophilus ramosus]|uniref:Cys-tRNA(Pro)/Cys-tRNA(Cys) deacylase n=2 Tax=Synergistales TaxID=649776 RepID=A0A9Q7F0E0_9BACT|nr:Cys-tRNA(Pro) deacylase [Aminithiophilus ramosus]QTX33027.1 Cys-tRNA(Pro) deacylase [Aminithiophilus ramosus]QVL37212.1 Cys-tRNA(Pro) deacylase [Synergistota bacterium]